MQLFQFNPLMYDVYKRQHEELIMQAEQSRLVKEALRGTNPESHGKSKLLAFFEKELESLGFSLELRFGEQPDPYKSLSQQSTPGGCA